jgi:hypothetical protein
MSATPVCKYRTNIWKEKLRFCQKEKKHLKKENQRLQVRLNRCQATIDLQQIEIISLREKVNNSVGYLDLGPKPQGHKYRLAIIFLAIHFQALYGLSYRQTRKVLGAFMALLQIDISIPSATSIRNWVRKSAYHRIYGQTNEDLERILVIDECAGIGQEKVLMILGLCQENIQKGQTIGQKDASVLAVKSQKSWTGEQINELINQTMERIGGRIQYIISDRCSNLTKAFTIGNHIHINDCGHLMANCMEYFYKNDVDFKALMGLVGKIRQKWVNSKNVGLIAPNMRTKARFMNLFPIVDWMEKVSNVWHKLSQEQGEVLSFLLTYKDLIAELVTMTKLIKALSKAFKTNGISSQSVGVVNEIFEQVNLTNNVLVFKQKMLSYIEEKRASLPELDYILCCSDVIETYFGKFKNRSHQGTAKGITDDMIVMSLFKGNLSKVEVRTAMESVKLKEIEQWSKQNTVPSFAKTKNQFWQNLGAKNN